MEAQCPDTVSLVVPFFLLFAFVNFRNPCHLGNERFDDLIDRFVDGHRFRSSAAEGGDGLALAELRHAGRSVPGWRATSREDNLSVGTWFTGAGVGNRHKAHPVIRADGSGRGFRWNF